MLGRLKGPGASWNSCLRSIRFRFPKPVFMPGKFISGDGIWGVFHVCICELKNIAADTSAGLVQVYMNRHVSGRRLSFSVRLSLSVVIRVNPWLKIPDLPRIYSDSYGSVRYRPAILPAAVGYSCKCPNKKLQNPLHDTIKRISLSEG